MTNNDFSDLGKQIESAVQNALNSDSVKNMKKYMSSAMQDTVQEIRDAISEGMGKKGGPDIPYRPNNAANTGGAAVHPQSSRAGGGQGAYRQPRRLPAVYTRKPAGRVASVLFLVFGFILMGSVLPLSLLGTVISWVSDGFASAVPYLTGFTLPAAAVSLGLIGGGFHIRGRLKRYRRYLTQLQGRSFCSVKELASSVGESPQFVVKDLRKMIRLGMFPQGHLDDEKTCLMLTSEVYGQYLRAKESAKYRELEEKAVRSDVVPEAEEETKKSEPAKELETAIQEGQEYIRQIRLANDRIPGPVVSEKLTRLEHIVTKIFDYVQKHPEKLADIRKFMSYYLPTTLKLVQAYCEFDQQSVAGENVAAAKKEIEDTLDTINTAFANLLDSLFEDAVMDVSTDISVLETMLKQEGLTGSDFNS
ncbi:5-bromo-4-chloroindolyl phosphate hydrolysis family protein [Lachnotalea sp. AF33-28]|uniref:5-bromo-4-chloroindolyl phosphate hydrolysis family protein n=1 Tax=Lachnotalea sp. AF33-28 TaxID=2292046 RepID=UPI000E4E45D1|nr:5-bromo-4-chloroindolyl phosphate hydrolysis family protein [Lachnotalea sp. AF33-28]RHP35665.1 5-bromo-4-chloroindolyl phosphate hydrolysis domain protein [Lachnotalea sp. AF33-28]